MNPNPDDKVIFHALGISVTRAQLGGYVRAALTAVAGWLVAKGYINAELGSGAVAAVMAWSHLTNAPATPPAAPKA